MSKYFEFFCPVKILSGHTALENIPFELSQLRAGSPLLLTDKGVAGAGLLKHITDAFRESNITVPVLFDEVPPDSAVKTVNEVAGLYRRYGCDSIIAVGGGSVMDTATGVNIVVSEKSNDLMKFMGAGILKRPLKPLIAVPTTSGTGSEVTLVAVIADTEANRKMLFTSYFLLPNVAVIDSRMTMTLPPLLTAATGMDALTHAVEAYTCLGKNPLSDAYAYAAIRLIRENIVKVTKSPQDREGRLALANAAAMAGIAFSNSMVGMVHTLGHTVGALCHIPHGVAMNILLPYVLSYNLDKGDASILCSVGELLLPLAEPEVFVSTPYNDRPYKTIEMIEHLKQALFEAAGLPRTLKESGLVRFDQLDEIAGQALNDASLVYNPVEMELDDALTVLKKAF
ncbi:MAG: iron-containing alcohol dehydrogenase [Spirochaetota bacterium]